MQAFSTVPTTPITTRPLLSHTTISIPITFTPLDIIVRSRRSAEALDPPGRHLHTTCGDSSRRDSSRLFIARAFLGNYRLTAQHAVNRIGNITMHNQFLPTLLFDYDIKSRWRFSFKNTFLGMAPASLFISKSNSLNTAN